MEINMNVELTTDNIRKSCRVCLGKGELNMWEHSISLKDKYNCEISQNSEINVIELFKMYENCNNSLLCLDDEIKLLCFSCLDELTNSYIFYKKASYANIQIKNLYEEAQKVEAEQLIDVAVEVLENEFCNETDINAVESKAHDVFEPVEETQSSFEYYVEEIDCVDQDQVEYSSANAGAINQFDEVSEKKYIKNLIDSDKYVFEETHDTITEVYLEEIKPTAIRQQRNKNQLHKPSVPTKPSDEEGALVVTQFLPSTAHIVLENTSTATMKEDEGGGRIQLLPKLKTVDYAAVEIKSVNLQQIIDEELQLQNTKTLSPESLYSLDNYGNNKQMQESVNSAYFCKFCPQAFAAPHYLIAHVRKSHVCKYCTLAFTKSVDLFVHIRQAHHQHKCAICNKELSSHSNLRGHIKRVHGIRLPAQVALLDYRPPSSNTTEAITDSNSTFDNTSEDINIYS